eukprot:UN06929
MFKKQSKKALQNINVGEMFQIIDCCYMTKKHNIPKSIVQLIAELSIFVPLTFTASSKRIKITETSEGFGKATMIKGESGYCMAITDGVYSSGIHKYEVLVGPTPSNGCC